MASLEAADPGDCRRSPAPIRRIRAHGAKFVDGDGAQVLLRGVMVSRVCTSGNKLRELRLPLPSSRYPPGFETDTFCPHGLWARPLAGILDNIAALGFNLIRLPFSNDILRQGARPKAGVIADRQIQGLSCIELLDLVVRECNARRLWVLLDRCVRV